MTIEVICPLYNAEKYIRDLDSGIKRQKNVNIQKISYILTESDDNTKQILNEIAAKYDEIKLEEFSHSLSREKIAMKSGADILVFITQDVEIRDDDWLEKLVMPIINNEAEASFSRQLTKFNNIEKYTREKNYPNESYIVSKKDIERFGLRTFFFSDASSAINRKVFQTLNGYDQKDLPTNEDMYIAYKLILNDYKIKYCSDSVVYHSHQFSLKQLYKRYYATGLFFSQNKYLNEYDTTKAGKNLAIYILKRIIEEKDFRSLMRFFPDMIIRFVANKIGIYIGTLQRRKLCK